MIRFFKISTLLILLSGFCVRCASPEAPSHKTASPAPFDILHFTPKEAGSLVDSSMFYLEKEYPYRLGALGSAADLLSPKQAHPAFYGCGDWSTAVITTAGLVRLASSYPDLDSAGRISSFLLGRITPENIQKEVDYLNNPINRNSNRGNGWNSLLKLALELKNWDHPNAAALLKHLQPLTQLIEVRYKTSLVNLVYPYKGSTANGLSILWRYAQAFNQDSLQMMAAKKAKDFFLDDMDYVLSKESSKLPGLSPGLEEINVMRTVLSETEFKTWLASYCPELTDKNFSMAPALKEDKLPSEEEQEEERERVMNQLSPADMLNISRANNLVALGEQFPEYAYLKALGYQHIIRVLPHLNGETALTLRFFHSQL